MLSKTTEYALRLVVTLAEAPQRTVPCQALAERAQVPEDYATRILCDLRRANIVTGERGRLGGYRIRKPLTDVSLLDVVQVVQPIERITSCPLGYHNSKDELCPLHRCIDDAIGYLEARLRETTLQSVVDTRHREGLCSQRTSRAGFSSLRIDKSTRSKRSASNRRTR